MSEAMSSRTHAAAATTEVLYADPLPGADAASKPIGVVEAGKVDGSEPIGKSAGIDRQADWIDALLGSSSDDPGARRWIDEFVDHRELGQALRLWVQQRFLQGERPTRELIVRRLSRDLAELDDMLSRQVNSILHHPRFQQLEASWRGLWYLTGQARENLEFAEFDESPPEIQIQILNISKRQLRADLENAIEFDQSQYFKKIHDTGFGIAGGFPFGVIIGDYEFTNHVEDVECLEKLAEVAAAAFCPFIASASPILLGLENFCSLERPLRLTEAVGQLEYLKWNAFRSQDDSRFVGLTIARIPNSNRDSGFKVFRSRVSRSFVWPSC